MEVKYLLIYRENSELELTNAQVLSANKSKEICDNIRTRFSETVREKRKSLGYSIKKLSRLSGVSSSIISKIEKGNYLPSLEVMFKISYPIKVKYGDVLKCFMLEDKKIENKNEYVKSLRSGDIIGAYSTQEKAEVTLKSFIKAYKDLKEEDFDIREIVWD